MWINREWGYIDNTGAIIIASKFDDVKSFHEGLAAVEINERWGYVDKAGKIVIQPQFTQAYDFSDGLASVRVKPDNSEGKYGYINKRG